MDLIIVGPTASGKTALSLEVAEHIGAPIISADARQCYIGMDIGTAKPSVYELARASHFNISLFNPDHKDDAAAFVARVAHYKREYPQPNWVIVGGSTLYLQSLMFPLDNIPKSDPIIQREIELGIAEHGLQQAWDRLHQLDPDYAKQMDGLNHQRIVRALCICLQTGRAFSSFHRRGGFVSPTNTMVWGLHVQREHLIEKINHRVDAMIQNGLVKEVQQLKKWGYDRDINALKTVGYTEVFDYLERSIDHDTMVEQIKAHTRQYARRQMTWFRRWPFIEWIDMDRMTTSDAAAYVIERLLSMETQRK